MLKKYTKSLELKGYADNTIKSYESAIKKFLLFFNNDISSLDFGGMLNYVSSLELTGGSINNNLSAIKNFLGFLSDYKGYKIAFDFDNLYSRKLTRRKIDIMSDDTFNLFFRYLEEKESYIMTAFMVLEDTGLRLSELTNLKKEDFLIIEGKAFLNVRDSKYNKSRIVPIFSLKLAKRLKKHTDSYIKEYLFYISNRGYQHYTIDFKDKYNRHINIHQFRHRFARRKLKEGMRIELLSKIMGHTDIATTMLYLDDLQDQILKMGVKV